MSQKQPTSSLLKTPSISGSISRLAKPTLPTAIGTSSKIAPGTTAATIKTPVTSQATPKAKVSLAPGVAEQYASGLLKKASIPKPSNEEYAFKVGDKVWVNGLKSGVVAFIGETKFAAGEWVGVHLDASDGKNDGSVAGVRYFTCEPMRGVFSKASKLTTHPVADAAPLASNSVASLIALKHPNDLEVGAASVFGDGAGDRGSSGFCSSASTPNENVDQSSLLPGGKLAKQNEALAAFPTTIETTPTTTTSPTTTESPTITETTPRPEDSASSPLTSSDKPPFQKIPSVSRISRLPRSNQGSNVSLNQLQEPGNSSSSGLRIGDRVVVGGTKYGTLKFVGTTLFAKGDWAGVELDEPMGKNDGAVDGKRYFKCPPLFGLFAPIAKVSRTAVAPTPLKGRMIPIGSNIKRAGSQESVSSVGSVQSSASRGGRVRLGVTSFANQTKSKIHPASAMTNQMNTSALEKALKEKEEHVEQLLAERDFERSEIARSETRAEEVERQLVQMKASSERLCNEMDELKMNIKDMEERNMELNSQLEEERRKVEDLQFTMEEVSIDKLDWENEKKKEISKFEKLTQQLEEEATRANQLDLELSFLKERQSKDTGDVSSEAAKNLADHLKLIEELKTERNVVDELRGKVSSLEEEVKKLMLQKEQLVQEVSLVKSELVQKIDTVEHLSNELSLKEESSPQKKKEKDEEINKLKFELQERECSVSLTLVELNAVKEELNDIKIVQKNLQDEKLKFVGDYEKKCQEVEELLNKHKEKENSVIKLKEEFDMQKTRLEEKLSEVEKSNLELVNDKNELVKTIDDIKKENESGKSEMDGEKEKLENDWKEKLKSLENQLLDVKQKNEDDCVKREDALNKLLEAEKLKNDLVLQLETANEKLSTATLKEENIIKELNDKSKQYEVDAARSMKDLELLRNQLETHEETEKELKKLIDTLKLELTSKSADDAGKMNILQELGAKKGALEKDLEVARSEIEKLNMKQATVLEENEKKMKDFVAIKENLEAEKKSLEEKLVSKNEEFLKIKSDHQLEVNKLAEKNSTLESDHKALNLEIESYKEITEKNRNEILKYSQDIEELKKKLDASMQDAEVRMSEEVDKRKTVEKEAAQLKENAELLKDEVSKMSSQLEEKEGKLKRSEKLVDEIKKENEALREERMKESETVVKEKTQEINNLKEKLQNEITSREAIEKELKNLTEMSANTKSELEKIKVDAKETLLKLETNLQETDGLRSSHEKELNNLKEGIDEKEKIFNKKLEEKDEEMELLKKELADSMVKISTLGENYDTRTRELNTLKSSSNEIVEFEKKKCESLSKDLNDAMKKLEEKDKEMESLRNEIADFQVKMSALNENLNAVTKELKTLKDNSCEAVELEKKKCESLSKDLEDSKMRLEERDVEMKLLKKELDESHIKVEDVGKFTNQLSITKNNNDECVEMEKKKCDDLSKCLEDLKNTVVQKDNEMELLKKEISDSRAKVASLSNDLTDTTNELRILKNNNCDLVELEKKKCEDLSKDLENLKKNSEDFERLVSSLKFEKDEIVMKLNTKEDEITSLNQILLAKQTAMDEMMKSGADLKHVDDKASKLLQECVGLKKELEEERIEKEGIIKDLKTVQDQMSEEVSRLENERNSATSNHEFEVNNLTSKITNLNGECDELKVSLKKTSNALAEKEQQINKCKEEFEKEKQKLEFQIKSSSSSSSVHVEQPTLVKGEAPRENEDHESLLAQIEFLNSVIVDIQSKNEKLQQQLDAALREDLDLSDGNISTSHGRLTAPRMFCDICDMFDQHDTDDCPKQAGSGYDDDDDDGAFPPSRNHGDPNLQRPYCDTCEVFGHSTEECSDDQTF